MRLILYECVYKWSLHCMYTVRIASESFLVSHIRWYAKRNIIFINCILYNLLVSCTSLLSSYSSVRWQGYRLIVYYTPFIRVMHFITKPCQGCKLIVEQAIRASDQIFLLAQVKIYRPMSFLENITHV